MKIMRALSLLRENTIEKRRISPSFSLDYVGEPKIGGRVLEEFKLAIFDDLKREMIRETSELVPGPSSPNGGSDNHFIKRGGEKRVVNEEETEFTAPMIIKRKQIAKKTIKRLLEIDKTRGIPIEKTRERILVSLRTLTFPKICQKNNIFYSAEVVIFIEESARELEKDLEKVVKFIVPSLRGALVNKTGKELEKNIKKVVLSEIRKNKNLSSLPLLKNVLVELESNIEGGIKVVHSRINSAPYDLRVLSSKRRKFIFGIHVKLLANPTVVSSMGNKKINFGKGEWEASKDFIKSSVEKYNLNAGRSTPFFIDPKEIRQGKMVNKGVEVDVLDFVNSLISKLKGETSERHLIDGITTLCRINSKRAMWILVFPGSKEVSWSPEISLIRREKGKINFFNPKGEKVFRVDATSGRTEAVLSERGKNVKS